MISKNQIKLIRSLEHKKYRLQHNLFVAEGTKTVGDMLGHFNCHGIIATNEWINQNGNTMPMNVRVDEIDDQTLRKVSFLEHPQQVLAIFEIPSYEMPTMPDPNSLVLALDGVQNPGNLGTIIRLADWFGIKDIVCSIGTVDAYNPKTVQAAMGSLSRVRMHYLDLQKLLLNVRGDIPIYGTFLNGDNIYSTDFTPHGVLVMGNEGQGISPAIEAIVSKRLTIPNFNSGPDAADSLNVAVATAILCSEFRRRI